MSNQQKKELAKYYTSMSGINETSVNAYMAISGAESEKRRKPRRKKKCQIIASKYFKSEFRPPCKASATIVGTNRANFAARLEAAF